MKIRYNLRTLTARTIEQVLDQRQSLATILPPLQAKLNQKDRALLQELSFGIMRVLPQLEWILHQLMKKPLPHKQRLVHYLLIVGLYELIYTRISSYATVSETVEGTIILKQKNLKNLVNGVLRQFLRQQVQLQTDARQQESHHLHPIWLQKRLITAWPDKYQDIIKNNNQRPPMWLRVNRLQHSGATYLEILAAKKISAVLHPELPEAIKLQTPCKVDQLPGFYKGWITVQDVSAQICALLLSPHDGEEILDLCAAPGGKTTHILELAPKARITAVDINPLRAARIHENLQRLKFQAKVIIGDARRPEEWGEKRFFDRILLDAPCSATGIIRRHPDIKWLRKDTDIANLAKLQREILEAAWPILKPGGTLLYSTCSILPEENCRQISIFLSSHSDASLCDTGDITTPGTQCFPSPEAGDGFFYAKMIKYARLLTVQP